MEEAYDCDMHLEDGGHMLEDSSPEGIKMPPSIAL
jgi:hypothetical protein